MLTRPGAENESLCPCHCSVHKTFAMALRGVPVCLGHSEILFFKNGKKVKVMRVGR